MGIEQVQGVMSKLPHMQVMGLVGDLDGWLAGVLLAQVALGMLMQLSYVAFPAYNFVLGIWGFASCSSTASVQKNLRMVTMFAAVLSLSVLADVIWSILWIAGKVFYTQTCGATRVTLVTCGSFVNSYPGCKTNRFAFVMLFVNIWVKLVTLGCLFKAYAKSKVNEQNQPTPQHDDPPTPGNPAMVHPTPSGEPDHPTPPGDLP